MISTRIPAQRWTSWLLLIAFLHATLAPSIGLAAGGQAAARPVLMSLCGPGGHQFVEVDLPDTDDDSGAIPELQHDGFCLLCVSPAMPVTIGIAGRLFDSSRCVPSFLWDDPAPRLARAWNPALARAPPACA